MLSLRHEEGATRLYITYATDTPAWIEKMPGSSPLDRRDWKIWVQRTSGPPQARTSCRRLTAESRLRTWLIRHYHCRLFDLCFADLPTIAERETTHTAIKSES